MNAMRIFPSGRGPAAVAALLITALASFNLNLAAQEPAAEAAPVPPVNPLRTQDELQRAYQKEYAFLEAQLRDLQTRLAQFESESRRDEQQREAQIDRVEGHRYTYDELKDDLRRFVENQKIEMALADYIEELEGRFFVDIKE